MCGVGNGGEVSVGYEGEMIGVDKSNGNEKTSNPTMDLCNVEPRTMQRTMSRLFDVSTVVDRHCPEWPRNNLQSHPGDHRPNIRISGSSSRLMQRNTPPLEQQECLSGRSRYNGGILYSSSADWRMRISMI